MSAATRETERAKVMRALKILETVKPHLLDPVTERPAFDAAYEALTKPSEARS